MTNKELAEKLRWYGNLAAMGPVDCELPEEACDDLFAAADALEAMPAADVAPVVHGRLVREVREVTDAVSVKGWACSVCGGFVKNQPVDRWRYCPFCGALFDGGEADGQKV